MFENHPCLNCKKGYQISSREGCWRDCKELKEHYEERKKEKESPPEN